MRVEGPRRVPSYGERGHIALPKASDRPRRPYVEPKRKPTGLDWSTLKPACRTCGTRTSALNRADQCTSCAPPAPIIAPRPVKKRKPRPPKSPQPRARRQYPRPIGPQRRPGRPPIERDGRPIGMPRAPRIDKIQLDGPAIAATYLAGQTLRQLADEHGVSSPTIARTLDEQGVARRKQRVDYNADLIAAVRALYVDEGLDQQQVAQRLAVTTKVVQTAMARGNIQPRESASARSRRGIGHPIKINPETAEQIVIRYRAGEAGPQLAKQFGVSSASIYHLLTKHAVPRHGRRTPGLGSDGSAGLKQRIRDLGVTPSDINRWALEAGLMDLPKPGLPSAITVDAWEQAHASQEIAS